MLQKCARTLEEDRNSYQADGACFQLCPLYLKRQNGKVRRVSHKHLPQHSALFIIHWAQGHSGHQATAILLNKSNINFN